MISEELYLAAKAGNASEAYPDVHQLALEGTFDPEEKNRAGWIIFYYLKQNLGTLSSILARSALSDYLKLECEKPSVLHSNILNLAAKVAEKFPEFKLIKFVRICGADSFAAEDRQSREWNGRQVPPLYDRFIRNCFINGAELDEVIEVFNDEALVLRIFADWFYGRIYLDSRDNGGHDLWKLACNYTDAINGRAVKNEAHSKILNAVLWDKAENNYWRFREFFEKWGLNNFTDQDWRKEKTADGKSFSSLAERAIGRYLKAVNSGNHEYHQDFAALMETAYRKCPDNETICRTKASMMAKDGDKEGAFAIISKLIKSSQKWYLWSDLAELSDDAEKRIGFYCKTLSLQSDDSFTVRIRQELAKEFIAKGMFPEALHELKTVESVYSSHPDWNLKQGFYDILNRIPQGTVPSGNEDTYSRYSRLADGILYDDYPEVAMVFIERRKLEDRNAPGRFKTRYVLMSADGITIEINPKAWGLDRNLQYGACFMVRYAEENHKKRPLTVTEVQGDSPISTQSKVMTISRIDTDRRGNRFVKQDNIYINSRHLSGISQGDNVKVWALSSDGVNWRAYKVERR